MLIERKSARRKGITKMLTISTMVINKKWVKVIKTL
jgi:hypothetical protein